MLPQLCAARPYFACARSFQIEETFVFYTPKTAGPHRPGLKRPQMCFGCKGWFDGPAECAGCNFLAREVTVSWNNWQWAIMAQVHTLLRANFRERRGKVTLLAVPPSVGFALLKYYSWPQPSKNRGGPIYKNGHDQWKQGTSKNGSSHYIKFSYDCMEHATWAFPLHNYHPKTTIGPVRLVFKKRFQDHRLWGTPIQFKYKWTAQRTLGIEQPVVHIFTICSNITHVGMAGGAPRWNTEYARWVPELQLEHIVAVKDAVKAFPSRPLRSSSTLASVVHPGLAANPWALAPTPMPQAVLVNALVDDGDGAGGDADTTGTAGGDAGTAGSENEDSDSDSGDSNGSGCS